MTVSGVMQWLNGVQQQPLSELNRGLAYGDGVFETILCREGRSALWSKHKARLLRGLTVLGIPVPELDWLSCVFQEAANYPCAVLKLIVVRGGSAAGYRYQPQGADVLAILKPMPILQPVAVNLAVSEFPLVGDVRLEGIKHLNRLPQVLAAQEASARGVDELLLADTQGLLVEAISSNVFLLGNDGWVTPVLSGAGVAGVMRASLLDPELALLGASVIPVPMNTLKDFRAGFLCNAVRGVMPIQSINGRVLNIEACEPIVERVKQFLHA